MEFVDNYSDQIKFINKTLWNNFSCNWDLSWRKRLIAWFVQSKVVSINFWKNCFLSLKRFLLIQRKWINYTCFKKLIYICFFDTIFSNQLNLWKYIKCESILTSKGWLASMKNWIMNKSFRAVITLTFFWLICCSFWTNNAIFAIPKRFILWANTLIV